METSALANYFAKVAWSGKLGGIRLPKHFLEKFQKTFRLAWSVLFRPLNK